MSNFDQLEIDQLKIRTVILQNIPIFQELGFFLFQKLSRNMNHRHQPFPGISWETKIFIKIFFCCFVSQGFYIFFAAKRGRKWRKEKSYEFLWREPFH